MAAYSSNDWECGGTKLGRVVPNGSSEEWRTPGPSPAWMGPALQVPISLRTIPLSPCAPLRNSPISLRPPYTTSVSPYALPTQSSYVPTLSPYNHPGADKSDVCLPTRCAVLTDIGCVCLPTLSLCAAPCWHRRSLSPYAVCGTDVLGMGARAAAVGALLAAGSVPYGPMYQLGNVRY
eukprot:2407108-Rhodomonas_salina.1